MSLSNFRYELCAPRTEQKCENKKRQNCRYKYRTVYKDVHEDVCEKITKKVCDQVRNGEPTQYNIKLQRRQKRNVNFVKQQLPGLACCC